MVKKSLIAPSLNPLALARLVFSGVRTHTSFYQISTYKLMIVGCTKPYHTVGSESCALDEDVVNAPGDGLTFQKQFIMLVKYLISVALCHSSKQPI